ncbi:hypothetical protein [Piscinibacter sp.]|uniref:hypothetical protein n=1 Tax=Piscinibacter sp. TaxID=1903157 RepID=UPI003559F914
MSQTALSTVRLADSSLTSTGSGTRLSTLSPSLFADLERFAKPGTQTELLEVLAACIRHVQPLTLILEHGPTALQLLLFPRQGLFICGIDLSALDPNTMKTLRVTHIEPTLVAAPENLGRFPRTDATRQYPLSPLLWRFALHGARSELLPEIAGPVMYRVSPALTLDRWMADRGLLTTLHALRNTPFSLHELAQRPGFSPERAERLLNGIYLQAGLIISRVHGRPTRASMGSWLRR